MLLLRIEDQTRSSEEVEFIELTPEEFEEYEKKEQLESILLSKLENSPLDKLLNIKR